MAAAPAPNGAGPTAGPTAAVAAIWRAIRDDRYLYAASTTMASAGRDDSMRASQLQAASHYTYTATEMTLATAEAAQRQQGRASGPSGSSSVPCVPAGTIPGPMASSASASNASAAAGSNAPGPGSSSARVTQPPAQQPPRRQSVRAAARATAEQEQQQSRVDGLAAELATLRKRLAEQERAHKEHRDRAAGLAKENGELWWGLVEAAGQRQRAVDLTAQNTDLRQRLAEAAGQQERAAALEGRLALYEGGAGPMASGQQWGEAELEAAAERLKAAAKRVEELRLEARVASAAEARAEALAEERVKRRRLEISSTFECPICCEDKPKEERRALFPCGHPFCKECAGKLPTCPTCRQPVKGTLRIFE
eukprot:tig00020825_g14294.t1